MACYCESFDNAKVSKVGSVKRVPLDGRAYVVCDAKSAKLAGCELGVHAFNMDALDMLEYLAVTANTEVRHTEDKRPRVAVIRLNYEDHGFIYVTDILFKAGNVYTDKAGTSKLIHSVDNYHTVLDTRGLK